jgi:hypothetical protein
MDANRFDGIARSLAESRSRRGVVKGLLGGAAAVVGAVLGRGPAEAAPRPRTCKVGCSGFNRQAKTACEKACKECGGNFDRVCTEEGPFGPTAFICCPEGTFCVGGEGFCCEEGTEPCFGPDGAATCCPAGTFCDFDAGACEPLATCPTGEPAENCFAGVETSCDPDGFCALVVDVDGGCACVERQCSFTSCATGADCDSGLCVDIPGCCGEPNPFCGTPCGTGTTGVRSSGSSGWQR